jgi:hypothetical protein
MRHLFLTSGHRDEVKYAMAIMSGFGQPGDVDPPACLPRGPGRW